MAICQFTTSLLLEDVLTNPAGSRDSPNHADECNSVSSWSRSSRIRRHARWFDSEDESLSDSCPSPPLVVVNFFKDFLPPEPNSSTAGPNNNTNKNVGDSRINNNNNDEGDGLESNAGVSASDQDRSCAPPVCSKEEISKRTCLLKASLWHAIWSHANTTHLTALPRLVKNFYIHLYILFIIYIYIPNPSFYQSNFDI